MKKIIALFLCLCLIFNDAFLVRAENEEQYGTIQVEFSDKVGEYEVLHVMTKGNALYVNAEELIPRLGYQLNTSHDEAITIYNSENEALPEKFVQLFYGDVRVRNKVFTEIIDDYEAPFESIRNEQGVWIPMEYALILLNSSMLIVEDTVVINMPEKNIVDIYMDIMKNNSTYLFDWGKDFGYTDFDIQTLGIATHLVNQFQGILDFDGDSWQQLLQSFCLSSSAYDKKYGEDISLLLCSESDGELEALKKQASICQNLFSTKGKLGGILSKYSQKLDEDVGNWNEICEELEKRIKAGNSSYVNLYNKAYKLLEKAFDKQSWFLDTVGVVLDTQKQMSADVPLLDVFPTIIEVVQYGEEFANQDEFSVDALEAFLQNSTEATVTSEDMKNSMRDFLTELKGNVVEYSVFKFFKENVGGWVKDAVKDGKLLGTQGNMALGVWNMLSTYWPFASNGLAGADKFELALYSSVLQSDAFLNYQKCRNEAFSNVEDLTGEELYKISQYCYLYMKTCYITRESALASLVGKREEIKEQIEPLLEQQKKINAEIADILIRLKTADKSNKDLKYGFLPENNKEYLDLYAGVLPEINFSAGPSQSNTENIPNTESTLKDGNYRYSDGDFVAELQVTTVGEKKECYWGEWYNSGASASVEDFVFTWEKGKTEYEVQGQRSGQALQVRIEPQSESVIITIENKEGVLYYGAGMEQQGTVFSAEYIYIENEKNVQSNIETVIKQDFDLSSSSVLQEGNYDYSVASLVDMDTQTCWAEGVPGIGEGECIIFSSDIAKTVSGLAILPGYFKSSDLFYKNGIPLEIKITSGEWSWTWSLEDFQPNFSSPMDSMIFIDFKEDLDMRECMVTLTRCKAGNKYDDVCITEMFLYKK